MDRNTKYLTSDDLDRVSEGTRRKTKWGRWKLDKKAYPSLDIHPNANGSAYQIRLFEYGCDFATFTAWLGRWAEHLQGKGWMSYKDLWDFVDATQDIYRRGTK